MKWFKEVFLPSIADGLTVNHNSPRWITEKQVAICLRYMKPDPYSPCDKYQIKVNGIWYFLYVKKKGYGGLYIADHL